MSQNGENKEFKTKNTGKKKKTALLVVLIATS